MIYNLFVIPFYNHYFKQYSYVLSLDHLPPGPINQYIYKYHLNSLSSNFTRDPFKCYFILSRPDHSIKSINFFYSVDDIPLITHIFKQLNYNIISQSSPPLPYSSTYKKNLVFSFSYPLS